MVWSAEGCSSKQLPPGERSIPRQVQQGLPSTRELSGHEDKRSIQGNSGRHRSGVPTARRTQGDKSKGGKTKGGSDDISTMIGKTFGDWARTNSKGDSHCFNCGSPSHWAYECPQLIREQQTQLHMNQEAQEDTTEKQAGEEGHQMMHVSFSQGGKLPDN